MKKLKRSLLLTAACFMSSQTQALPLAENPLYISGNANQKVNILDGTIEYFNGQFLVNGFVSEGKAYPSHNMRDWRAPYVLVDNTPSTFPSWADDSYGKFGAGDILVHNGVMFFIFNGMGLVHGQPNTMFSNSPVVAHSLPDHQYSEGIDAQFFVAHDGTLVYLRKVGPWEPRAQNNTGEAWIWTNNQSFFKTPYPEETTNLNTGKRLISGQKGHWATLDKYNFEGPEFYFHDGQYYLLYVGNYFGRRSGFYETGVAQNSNFNGFSNADKYPGKLLSRNLDDLLLKYKPIIPTTDLGHQKYRFTHTAPSGSWKLSSYNDSSWVNGNGGFGWPIIEASTEIPGAFNNNKTAGANIWSHPSGPKKIWLRRSFNLSQVPNKTMLRYRFEGKGKIFINGKQIFSRNGFGGMLAYKHIEIPSNMLNSGSNVISAEAEAGANLKANFIDFGIYDTKGLAIEPEITMPSQPNIIRGKNGFEHWAVYKGVWNEVNGQGKDRVFFWGDEMTVDGPSHKGSSNKPLDASDPTLFLNFSNVNQSNSFTSPANMVLENNRLKLTSNKFLLFSQSDINNAYIETNILFTETTGINKQAGFYAWYKDANNWVKVFLVRNADKVKVVTKFNGNNTTEKNYPLPASFNFIDQDARTRNFPEQFTPFKIYKNGQKITAKVGHYFVNNGQPILNDSRIKPQASMGLLTGPTQVYMDNVVLTQGYEDNGNQISGWANNWTVNTQGIRSPKNGTAYNTKDKKFNQYEISAHVDAQTLPNSGKVGLIASQVNANDRVVVRTNYQNQKHEVVKFTNGNANIIASKPAMREVIYGYNFEQAFQTSYQFNLRGKAKVNGVRILWHFGNKNYVDKDYKLPNPSSNNFKLEYSKNNSWTNTNMTYPTNGRGQYNDGNFSTVTTDKLKLRVPGNNNRPYAFAVKEQVSSQNFYRVAREDGRLLIWVNNVLMFNITDPHAGMKTKTGLYSDNVEAYFDSITYFER